MKREKTAENIYVYRKYKGTFPQRICPALNSSWSGAVGSTRPFSTIAKTSKALAQLPYTHSDKHMHSLEARVQFGFQGTF